MDVYDGSEIGQLQAGFNSMVDGLRERERIQDLFGRHVGEEVARAALEQGIELGGEVRDVAVLFTDVVGSTQLAAERPPEEVVELLNRFFAVVVEVVRKHGGWVNKFEGDAALAIFGAPTTLDDAAAAALAAARELAERLPKEVDGLEAAIGVSAGEAVAGNIGEESRFEYTVIGDPVNEAARLTELAKEKDGHAARLGRDRRARRRGGGRPLGARRLDQAPRAQRGDPLGGPGTLNPMCRNIRQLHNFDPPASRRGDQRRSASVRAQDQRLEQALAGERGGL